MVTYYNFLYTIVTAIACFIGLFAQDNYNADEMANICKHAPSESQIKKYESQCEGCNFLTHPLSEIRTCCEVPTWRAGISCLENWRKKEVRINNLFLSWKEEPEMDAIYREHMLKCNNVYSKTFGNKGCTQGDKNTCLDPLGMFNLKCSLNDKTKQGSTECVQGWPISMKHNTLASVCVNNHNNGDGRVDKLFSLITQDHSTVHYKCFNQQALSKKYNSLVESQEKLNRQCLAENFGSKEVNWETYLDYKSFAEFDMSSMWEESLAPGTEGVYEEPEKVAWGYMDKICNFGRYEHGQSCIETPITQTYITFQNRVNIENSIKSCCKGLVNLGKALSDDDKESVKTCLEGKGLYQQLYPLSGFYMRSLFREQTHFSIECQSEAMFKQGNLDDYDQMSQADRSKYRLLPNTDDFSKNFSINALITPINYHFFLRHFAQKTDFNDEFYKAACDACKVGEKLGLKAYVYPGLMCPALVSQAYYKPIRDEEICEDKLFYKFQVAHYCCLAAAVEKYDFGSNYASTCPDLTGVRV